MRHALSVLVLAAAVCLAPCAGLAQQGGAVESPVPAAQRALTPSAADLADPAGTAGDNDPDAPPPFMRKPKLPPRPVRADLTYAQHPAPMEFRGLPWGSGLDGVKARLGLAPVTNPHPLPDTYYRPQETLNLGQASLVTVAYYFPKGRFTGAGLVLSGEANYFLAKDHLIGLYGPGRQIGEHYGWTWPHMSIDMRLRDDGMGEVRYTYEP